MGTWRKVHLKPTGGPRVNEGFQEVLIELNFEEIRGGQIEQRKRCHSRWKALYHTAVSGGWRGQWECGGEAEGEDED